MKTLTPLVAEELITRFGQLRPGSRASWGRMNAPQMVRHLLDSLALAMGERSAAEQSTWVQRHVVKHLAFRLPMHWPKGVPTRPEFDQEISGTKPGNFDQELLELAAALRRFAAQPRDFHFGRHPVFLDLSQWEWMRWGWLHADHHLRQFGL